MKAAKKAQRSHDKMLEWLAKAGKDVTTLDPHPAAKETFSEEHLEGQAVLAYWENGKVFKNKTCRSCFQVFATNYNSVDTCSLKCLKQACEDLGFTWRPEKSAHERWGRTPPLIVPESARLLIDQMKSDQKNLLMEPVADSLEYDDIPEFPDF